MSLSLRCIQIQLSNDNMRPNKHLPIPLRSLLAIRALVCARAEGGVVGGLFPGFAGQSGEGGVAWGEDCDVGGAWGGGEQRG